MHVRPVPKVSIFMALTTKIVTEKAKKWPKMARFWPKSRYNGRVMAREVFFYQCLWVTKFCAKFGCSRTPRTASVPNSFIVLRSMWKEPAPLVQNLHFWSFWAKYCHFLHLLSNSWPKNYMNKVPRWVFRYVGNKTFDFSSKKKDFLPKNDQIWPKICTFGHFGPNIAIFCTFCPMTDQKQCEQGA